MANSKRDNQGDGELGGEGWLPPIRGQTLSCLALRPCLPGGLVWSPGVLTL